MMHKAQQKVFLKRDIRNMEPVLCVFSYLLYYGTTVTKTKVVLAFYTEEFYRVIIQW